MSTIVVMPGGFHPFHAGHAALYNSARRAFPGAEVYVAATNDTSNRPFPFAIKEKLAKLAGVEPGHFVQVKSPFRAEEITANFNPEVDKLIFVRSEKDANKPPQAGGVKKDGSPSYLQPLLGAKKLEPFGKRAYMAYLPTVEFGPGMTSATEIRTAWPQLNDKRKTALVMSLYPATQKNPALAANVVKMLDAAIGGKLNESYNPFGKIKFLNKKTGEVRGFYYWQSVEGPARASSMVTNTQLVPAHDDGTEMSHEEFKQALYNKNKGIAEGLTDKPEAGDKITWYYSNHYPKIEGEVVGWKDGHLVVKSIDPSPRNTEKTIATYRVPTNNILSIAKRGVDEAYDGFGKFDAAEFQRHMEKLRAREELRKTDPMRALVGDLKDQDAEKAAAAARRKKPEDDSIGINDPRHPSYAYSQMGQTDLNEFAPSDNGGGRKFIPWPEFIDAVKQIVGKDFAVTEKVVKSTIQDRFIPHDPMEYGPTMLYSYYEARAGRGKGAVSTRGAIQVGKYYPNNTALGKQNFITSFNLLKGHPFERHFDLTFDNIYKIANIIQGNTEGAFQMQPVAEVTQSGVSPQAFVGGMHASYQDRENQPIDEDYLDESPSGYKSR